MRINDRQLKTFVAQLNASTKALNDENVVDLLAAVGDRSGKLAKELREDLQGKTRQEQFDLVKPGLGSTEKNDVKRFLKQSAAEGFTMTPLSKNFLEALVGLAPLDTGLPPLPLGADRNGIRGNGLTPGAEISVLNMSDIVDGRQHVTEARPVATADANGSFFADPVSTTDANGHLRTMDPGDWLRIAVKSGSAEPEWFSVQVSGTDTTAPLKANTDRINLADKGSGVIEVSHNTARPMAEPFANLRLTNLTTGQFKDFKATDKGSFEPFTIDGTPRHVFSIAINDGKNNLDFSDPKLRDELRVGGTGGAEFDIPDPELMVDDRNGGYGKTRFTGPLFSNGVDFTDPVQGAIGNCYEPSGTSAAAWADPDAVRNGIKEIEVVDPVTGKKSKKYQVTFYDVDWYGRATKVVQEVDGDLWTRSSGSPLYGATLSTPRRAGEMELWYSIHEKARAQWKGGYEVTGQGGISGEVSSEIFGRPYEYESVNNRNANRVFEMIKQGSSQTAGGNKNWAMTAGTYGHDQDARYAGQGVYANHAYTVTGATEENGVKYVHLRNPWGQSEPAGNGANDGIFKLPLDKFVYLYQSFNYVDPNGAGPSLNPVDPNQPLNATRGSRSLNPVMTTAQKGLNELVRLAEAGELHRVTPQSVTEWLLENHGSFEEASLGDALKNGSMESLVDTTVRQMSLESALQALKDLKRFKGSFERIQTLQSASRLPVESIGTAVDGLEAKLQAVVERERASIKRSPRGPF